MNPKSRAACSAESVVMDSSTSGRNGPGIPVNSWRPSRAVEHAAGEADNRARRAERRQFATLPPRCSVRNLLP